jgi:hypothetical protein
MVRIRFPPAVSQQTFGSSQDGALFDRIRLAPVASASMRDTITVFALAPIVGLLACCLGRSRGRDNRLSRRTKPRPKPRARAAHSWIVPRYRGWCNRAVGSSPRC